MRLVPKVLEKLLSKTYPEPNTGCWLWAGMLNVSGYGIMKSAALPQFKTPLTHRISYFLHNGEFNYSLHVLHKCDTPTCINPDHLFLGTHQDNIADRVKKNRSNRVGLKGEKGSMAKLTSKDIDEIRRLRGTMCQRLIGEKFNVKQSTIHYILSGKTWK